MPKLATQLTTTTTVAVELKPKQRKELQTALAEYESLSNQIDALKEERDALNGDIEAIRVITGQKEFEFEGSKVTRVEGETTYCDWDMIISEGWMSPSQKERAHKKKAKKAYTLVTTAGRKRSKKGED